MRRRPLLSWDTWLGPTVLTFECQSATIWHFCTQLRLALGTLALSSVWHLALWHSAPFGTWHFGTRGLNGTWHLALGTRDGAALLCTRYRWWRLPFWQSRWA